MNTIRKREMQGYFYTPVGYVFIGVFLAVSSVLFYMQILRQRSGDLPGFISAMCYLWMYGRSQVAIDDASLRVASPMNIIPKPGEARASFVFRQGGGDIRFVDKTLRLDAITRYGYVEDLGYKQIDASQASERNKLFPVHEVAFITDDNKRYHMNAAIYSRQQRKEIFTLVRQRSGVDPTGRLLKELGE